LPDDQIEAMRAAAYVFDEATKRKPKARRGDRVKFKHELLGQVEGVVTGGTKNVSVELDCGIKVSLPAEMLQAAA
jgi:hypothetical protein